MKSAIILHGMPSKKEYFDAGIPSPSNNHWLPWTQKQLLINNILAQAIELPETYDPVYEKWAKVFGQMHVDEQTMLIGHSCGAGFLVRWLSKNSIKVGKVALVAPFLDPNKIVQSDFFDFEIDPLLMERVHIKIFYSTDDIESIITSVATLREKVPSIEVMEFIDRGHFTLNGMKTEKFPELIDWLLQ